MSLICLWLHYGQLSNVRYIWLCSGQLLLSDPAAHMVDSEEEDSWEEKLSLDYSELPGPSVVMFVYRLLVPKVHTGQIQATLPN